MYVYNEKMPENVSSVSMYISNVIMSRYASTSWRKNCAGGHECESSRLFLDHPGHGKREDILFDGAGSSLLWKLVVHLFTLLSKQAPIYKADNTITHGTDTTTPVLTRN